jgi:hypothetical protein
VGGPGSGQWYRWDKRRTLEDCRTLDARQIHRKGLLAQPGMVFAWAWWNSRTGERTASIKIGVERDYLHLSFRYRAGEAEWESMEQIVPLNWTPCNYGGRRPWFLCPGFACGRRVAVLVAGGRLFLCRHCYRLPYASTLETRTDRLLRKANKIRKRLGGEPGALSDFPERSKGMHHSTYERLREEALMAEERGLIEVAWRLCNLPGEPPLW